MVSKFLIFAPSVAAFKFQGAEPLGACEQCICQNDPGTDEDLNDKHCCPTVAGEIPETWDDYCDLLALDACKDECYENDDPDTLVLSQAPETLGSRSFYNRGGGWGSQGWGSSGAALGGVCYQQRPCQAGLVCVNSNGISPVCQRQTMQTGVSTGSTGSTGQSSASGTLQQCQPTGAAAKANTLKNNGVTFLAWDWDMTAHNEHTYGKSHSSYADLANEVSCDFIELATAWCNMGMKQALVTYNDNNPANRVFVGGQSVAGGGPAMIRETLNQLESRGLSRACSGAMQIDGDNLDRTGQKSLGKNPHLQRMKAAYGVPTNAEIALFDDTIGNIQAARGTYSTVTVNPRKGFRAYQVDSMGTAAKQQGQGQGQGQGQYWG